MTLHRLAIFLILIGTLASQTGCGLLIGNVKPVDEKSEAYGVADLSKEKPDWERLPPSAEGANVQEPDLTATEVPDVAFQSRKNGAIISLNSACRENLDNQHKDLHALTALLFLGLSDMTQRSEKDIAVQKTPALETTVEGKMNGEPVQLRTVVLRRNTCIYDLVYMARPDRFAENESEFDHFVGSLRLK